MGLGDSLAVVAISVTKLVLAGGSCAYTYRSLLKRKQIEAQTLTSLARVNKQLLIPLFIFSKCAQGITGDTLAKFSFVPALIIAFMLTGYLAGRTSVWLSRAPPRAAPVATASCTFSNVLGLPLPLVESLVAGLAAYQDDREAQSRCVSYLFLANIASSTLMWTIAPRMLAPLAGGAPPLAGGAKYASDQWSSVMEGSAADVEAAPSGGSGGSIAARGMAHVCRAARGVWMALNRPTAASLLGMAVGVTPPLRGLLVLPEAPLRFLIDAMELLGKGAIPLILFVLGGQLSSGPTAGTSEDMPPRTIVAVIISKLLIVPSCNLGLILAALKTGLLPGFAAALLVKLSPTHAFACLLRAPSSHRCSPGLIPFFRCACSSSVRVRQR
mmetsp:Transcript_8127/g.20168  ORF Transcript_8127/g.20168 Transcript_8127/m.20168 type:complete len:384 (-) Transcript_8127:559-1710(-)